MSALLGIIAAFANKNAQVGSRLHLPDTDPRVYHCQSLKEP